MRKPSQSTLDLIAAAVKDALAAERASVAASVQAPAVVTFATSTNGVKFPCTASTPCERTDMKTSKRAATHDIETGHAARDRAEIARIAAKRAK